METTLEKIRKVSDQLYKLQLEIGTCEQRLIQLNEAEKNMNFIFFTIEEKSKWYQDWGKKVDAEIAKITENEKKLNELIK